MTKTFDDFVADYCKDKIFLRGNLGNGYFPLSEARELAEAYAKHCVEQEDGELNSRIEACRHYLMGTENVSVADALEALGFQRNGLPT